MAMYLHLDMKYCARIKTNSENHVYSKWQKDEHILLFIKL